MKQRDFSRYDAMTTEELEQYLQQDLLLDQDDSDQAVTLYIMEVLANRQNFTPKWEQFVSQYLPCDAPGSLYDIEEPPKRKRRIFPALLVAVVSLVALFAGTAQADNEKQIHNIAAWDGEEFVFHAQDLQNQWNTAKDETVVSKELTQEELFLRDIEPYLPTWIPEGFVSDGQDVHSTTYSCLYTNHYSCGDQTLMVSMSQVLGGNSGTAIEKDETAVFPYWHNGIQFYFMSNLKNQVLAWKVGDIEGFISGSVSQETLVEVMKSIPGPPWLQDNLDGAGIKSPVTPHWLPEGYTMVSSDREGNRYNQFIKTRYQCGMDQISLTIFEEWQEIPEGEDYEIGGGYYTIVQKETITDVYWDNRDGSCHLAGPITVEEAKKIIESLYQ